MSGLGALNGAQRRAVEHNTGPLIVLAGPGTGKTRVITHRIARLIQDGVRPDTIAAMTFTNKAAREMRERLGGLVGPAGEEIIAGTFHSLGFRIVARFGDTIGLPAKMDLIDSAQRKQLLEDAVLDASDAGLIGPARLADGGPADVGVQAWTWIEQLRTSAVFAADAIRLAGDWRGLVQSPPDTWDDKRLDAERARLARFDEAVAVYERFESACRERGLATFDDYILLPIRILRESTAAAAIVRDETRHIVVDEYQDVNGAQLELLRLLAPPTPATDICVVGDDDQAIYGFRGSDTHAFSHFAQTWTTAETITLSENYRSTPAVLSGAQRIIDKATTRFDATKTVASSGELSDDASPIEAVQVEKGTPWGGMIASMILADRAGSDRSFDSYAVIATTHAKLDDIAGQLELAGIPVARSRTPNALDDDAVRDVLEWIRLLVEGQSYAATRLLTRPPLRMSRDEAVGLRRAHDRVVAKARSEGQAAPGFMGWLAEQGEKLERVEKGEQPEAVERLLAWHTELSTLAASSPAHAVVSRIIELTGVAHAELLPARARAVRIGHLVSVLRYAREVTPRLDPPADLASFWHHYERLDDADKTFRNVGRNSVESEAETAFDSAGVRLITAHQSKGLEFDTVFVPNIGASSGMFGSVQKRETPALPRELTDDPETDARDEVRRLFYVAMTRAERRLVLLSVRAKSRSNSLHMFQELAWKGKTPLPTGTPTEGVLLRDERDVLHESAELGVGASVDALSAEGDGGAEMRSRVLAQARRDARLEAAEALEASDDAETTEAMLETHAERLAHASAWMAAIARLERGDAADDLPRWLLHEGLGERASALAQRLASDPDDGALTRKLNPPLRLSYSQIDAYKRCPACYYVRFVLGLVDRPTSAQIVGTVAHATLERFYRAWSHADNEGLEKPTKDDLLRHGRELFFTESERVGGVDRSQLVQIESQLSAGYDAFHDDDAEIVMIEEKLLLPYERVGGGDDVPHTIEAKIDRVERLGNGFRIVDYKTGKGWKKLIEPKADDLQLGIYALALAHHFEMPPEELTGEAAYWVLSSQETGVLRLDEMDLDRVRGQIDGAITGMLEGRFDRGRDCDGTCSAFLGAGADGN